MRWLVEVTSLGSSERDSRHVDADTWQTALQAARALRGETAPMSGFSIELLDEGCRAIDQASRLRYEVRRASEDAVPASRPGGSVLPPVFNAARAEVMGTVASQVVFKREQEATASMPLTYREYVYLVPQGTGEPESETLLYAQLELIRTSLERIPPGKLVNLAVFDAPFQGKPTARPVAALVWKDWRGAPVVAFPRRSGGSMAPPPSAATPSMPPPGFAPVPAPAFVPPHAHASVPAPVFAPPPAPPAEAAAPPRVAAPVPVSPFAPALTPAPAPVSAPISARPQAPMPVFAQRPASVPAPAALQEIFQATFPGAAPVPAPASASIPVPAPGSMPSQSPFSSPARSAPPASRADSLRPGTRVRGEDLIADLFEAMHELHFARDAVEGGDFCLALAMTKLPCQAGIVHQYDIDRREYVVTSVRGTGAAQLLLARNPENDPMLSLATRRRRAVVVPGDTQGDATSVERYVAVGGARSVVVVPVMQSGRFLGAIELLNPTDGQPFTDSDGNAVMYIAEQLAEFIAARGIVTDPERIGARQVPGPGDR